VTALLDDDIALEAAGEGFWTGAIAPGWDTPRGPLGGYVLAILMRGLELAVGDPDRSARSVNAHFLRPPTDGPVSVSARVERAGRSLSTVSGRLEQDGKLIALALSAYSMAWESPVLTDAPMPTVEPPPSDSRSAARGPLDQAPAFMDRLVFVPRFGDPPFTGSDRGEVGGWLGLRERRALDAPAIALLADSWFPAPWPRLAELAPAPTIDLSVHFRAPLPLEDTLLLGRFRNRVVRDGFFDEDGELWSPDGTLVAQSRQLGLLIGARVEA
jgi:acyl-coenzyme A thioesterase PaaI-like protein